MTLLDLLKTCNHECSVRIHFGHEDKYFDINSKDKAAFTQWLEWMGIYDSVEDYYNGDVESWNVQQITFTTVMELSQVLQDMLIRSLINLLKNSSITKILLLK